MAETILLQETFNTCPDGAPPPADWWVEGGERVWVENGRLRTKADPEDENQPGHVCTVWHRRELAGDLRVELDAHVISSTIAANNINLFLFYSDPSGKPLYETRASRESADYGLYHNLNGYIFTFLNGSRDNPQASPARFRMRRCPGFNLMTETFDSHCRRGLTYHLAVTRQNGRLTFAVDDTVYLEKTDENPWQSGLLGLRTFRTDLWWDNIRVVQV